MCIAMSNLTYSALAMRLYQAINSQTATDDEVISLLVESRKRAFGLSTPSALKLHNRLVRAVLSRSDRFRSIEYRAALQFVPDGALRRIESAYQVDPTSPGIALLLAMGYLNVGILPRATALLDRISRSGNSEESAIARDVLESANCRSIDEPFLKTQ